MKKASVFIGIILCITFCIYFVISFSSVKKLKFEVASSDVGSVINFGDAEWIVVQKDSTKVQLVSKYILCNHRFYDFTDGYTYADCCARRWLNNEFYNETFSASERKLILDTTLPEGLSDKVFLLSPDEASSLFPSYEDRILTYEDGTVGWWWLRSDTNEKGSAKYYNSTGGLNSVSHSAHTETGGIRPSVWVDIS